MPKVRLGDLTHGKPVPEGVYKFKVHSVTSCRDDDTADKPGFKSGGGGYRVRLQIIEGDEVNRNVFETFPVLDKEGEASAALFRLAGFLEAVYQDKDLEIDPQDSAEMDEVVKGTIDYEIYGDTIIEPADEKEGRAEQNKVKTFAPVK